jgi:hypothetical protein
MASPFSQYRGGIRPIEGIQQAGANIAKYTYEGLAGAGANIAEGIKAYQSNVAQNEQATEELNQIGQALIKQKQMFGDNPEFAEFGSRLDPLIDSVSGAPSKSLSQKLAILNNAKAVIGTTGADFQMYQTLKNAKAQQDMQTAQAGLPTTETIQGGAFIQDGKYGYNPNQDATANDQQFLGAINQMRKLAESRGEKFTVDTASALRNYHKNTILGVQQAQAAGQISAEQAAVTIEQLQNADKNLDRKEIQDSGLAYYEDVGATPTQSSLAQYATEKNLATPVAQTIAEQNAAKSQVVKPEITTPESVAISALTERNKKTFTVQEKNAKTITGALGALRDEILSGTYESPWYRTPKGLADIYTEKATGGKETVPPMPTKSLPFDVGAIVNEAHKLATSQKVSPEQARINASNYLKTEIGKVESTLGKLKEGTVNVEQKAKEAVVGKEPTVPSELPSTAGVGEIFAGRREAVVPISIEDKKQKLQAHFQKSWGYIPSNFDAIFKSLNPEANLQVMDTKWGPMQWDGKQWNQLDMNKAGYGKPLTTAQQRESVRGVFGQQRQDGSYTMVEKVPGSGVKVGGLFTGTDEALGKFNDLLASAGPAIKGVARLMEINDKFGESIQGPLIGEAGSIANTIIANLRTSIVGVGVVSDKDQKILENIVADPTRWLSLESADRARYVQLAKRITDNLKAQAAVNGLTLSVEGDTQATEKAIRANRLLTK